MKNGLTERFLHWLKIQEHDWKCRRIRRKHIYNLTGIDMGMEPFPVVITLDGVEVRGIFYKFEDTQQYQYLIEEMIWREDSDN